MPKMTIEFNLPDPEDAGLAAAVCEDALDAVGVDGIEWDVED